MDVMEILKAVILGIVEGITEWLPISSTGHMILVDEFLKMNVTPEFKEMFLVVIQLGAILAVVLLFWNKMWPFTTKEKGWVKKDTFSIWFKVLVACIPAAILELAAGDYIEAAFYNYWVVSLALIIFGMAFILIEDRNKRRKPAVNHLSEITYKDAFIIGIFQLIAAIFPGTSRSGATILGAILIGIARPAAAEFTFFLAVPVMFGASLIKVLKFGLVFTSAEAVILLTGMAVAFVVSVIVIRFLMGYIKKHDFKVFGWYRIILGVVVLGYFLYFA
ncbi:MAG: undecaprenyl-diphosphate phosphatase [Eubacteriales bacterium]|nr:undecaprenyl-diphosphate phosphatase [Eubacteriales bacterium]